MRSKLFSSFLTVFIFWWIFLFVKWGLGSLQDNFQSLSDIKKLLPFLNIKIPEAGIAQALYIQIAVFKTWTVPLIIIGTISTLIGVIIVWMYAYRYHIERLERVKPKGTWRGAYIGAIGGGGVLPTPEQLKKLKLANEPILSHPKVQKLKEQEIVLLREILETLYAYPEAYCGDGHDSSLYQHTIHVLNKLLEKDKVTGLMLIVAAAHDIGKITSFKKNDKGKWVSIKHHDKESAKLLALIPSFWVFEEMERRVMLMAVKYGHTPGNMPSFDKEDITMKRAMDILHVIHEVDRQATKEEKQRVLDKTEIEKVILESFINVLPTLHFQKPGLPKGAISSGWKIKGRLFLNEIQVREICMKNLDKDIRAALGGNYREKTEVTPFTSALLKAFNDKGWLVKTIDNKTLDYSEALWKIKAGTREFNGIIIIENLPHDIKSMLDSADTTYKVEVVGSQFENSVAEPDAMGLFKSKKESETKEETSTSIEESNQGLSESKVKSKKNKSFTDTNLEISLAEPKDSNIDVKNEDDSIVDDKQTMLVSENNTVAEEISDGVYAVVSEETNIEPEIISLENSEAHLSKESSEPSESSESFSLSGFLSHELSKEDETSVTTEINNIDNVMTTTTSVIDEDHDDTITMSDNNTNKADNIVEHTDKKQQKKKGPYDGLFK